MSNKWKRILLITDRLVLPIIYAVLFTYSFIYRSFRTALVLGVIHVFFNWARGYKVIQDLNNAFVDLETRAARSDNAILDVANLAAEGVQQLSHDVKELDSFITSVTKPATRSLDIN